MKNLHSITWRNPHAHFEVRGTLGDWLRNEYIGDPLLQFQPYQREILGRFDTTVRGRTGIIDNLRRRAAEIRYNNRNVEDLAIVLTQEDYRQYREWLYDNPYYHYGMPANGPDRIDGIRIVRA